MDEKLEIVLVSTNPGKIREIQAYLPSWVKLIGLNDLGIHVDIPEDADTFEGNAQIKSTYFNKQDVIYLADDSGLMVDALDGQPGVHSARYSGIPKDDGRNRLKLLEALSTEKNRKASFKTVLALSYKGETHLFSGETHGVIIEDERGENGFGYDSIFIPDGENRTFAEMKLEEKAKFSHRSKALKKMILWLEDKKDEFVD